MSLKVFGCPGCQQPFQVGPEHAGQVVQCPACAQQVEIPSNAFESTPPATKPIVFQCPHCTGQFGVTAANDGQQVACPHCQKAVQIQLTKPEPETTTESEEIVIRSTSKAKTNKKQNAEDPSELFAPSSKKKKTPSKKKPQKSAKPPSNKRDPKRPTDSNIDRDKPSSPSPKSGKDQPAGNQSGSKQNTEQKQPLEMTRRAESSQTSPAPTQSTPTQSAEPTSPKSSTATVDEQPVFVQPDQEAESPNQESIAHLLPPKFDVLDPENLNFSSTNSQNKIVLPDGKGGTAQLDQRVLRVEHGGQQVSLVALTPQQKRRKRLIQNCVMIVIAIAVMAIAFSILGR